MHPLLDDILAAAEGLDPFPTVAVRVMEVAFQDEVDPAEVAAIVQTDPGLVAKVLRACNSASFGFRRRIGSIEEAAVCLGVRGLSNVALAESSRSFFAGYGSSDATSQDALWMQALTGATACHLLAEADGRVSPPRAWTVGLLANVGNVVLDRFLTRERDAVLEELRHGLPLVEAERSVLGIDHAQLGARLGEGWGLPDELVESMRYHHDSTAAPATRSLCQVAHAAEVLAWALAEQAGGANALRYLVADRSLDDLPEEARGLLEPLREEVRAVREMVES